MIDVGEQAPDFSLPASRSRLFRLSSLLSEGKTAVLVFYLLDFSPK